MSKPTGLSPTLQIIRSTRAEDKIWDAVSEAICDKMTVTDFIREAKEAWAYEINELAKDADIEFKKALNK